MILLFSACWKDTTGGLDSGAIPADGELVAESVHSEEGGIEVRRITYGSEGLRIEGIAALSPGVSAPTLLFLHSGWSGIWDSPDRDYVQITRDFAAAGFTVLGTSFRGQDGGEGEIDFCGDEVADALNLVPLRAAFPEAADPMVLVGVGNGGCAALMVNATEGVELAGTVTLSAPTDMARLLDWYRGAGDDITADNWWKMFDADPDAHSPVFYDLVPPIFAQHGMDDQTFPYPQMCALWQATEEGWGTGGYRLDPYGIPSANVTMAEDCGIPLTEGDPLADPNFGSGAVFTGYEGVDVALDARTWGHAVSAAQAFAGVGGG